MTVLNIVLCLQMTSETKVGSTISFSGYLYKTGPQAKSCKLPVCYSLNIL